MENGEVGWVNLAVEEEISLKIESPPQLAKLLERLLKLAVTTRTGNRTVITEVFDETSVGDRVVSRDLIPFMRSRNVQFISKRMKPLTRIYAFFDGKDVTRYCVPKLLEIKWLRGHLQLVKL